MDLSRIRRGARRGADVISHAVGYELIRRHFYSPIPDLASLPDEVWAQQSDLRGLGLDVTACLGFVQTELAEFMLEFRPPIAATGNPRDFHLDNGFYGALDAHTLYAMVRRCNPGVVLELGSGMSSLLIADAFKAGGSHGHEHIIYDPYPRADLAPALRSVGDPRAHSAVDVPVSEIERLRAGDLLFVDTSHTVKTGGDVNHVILDLLPALAPGVIVHIHDIYLPWEYPRVFLEERKFFWAEQYLLQAFLAFNDSFEILCANHALWRAYPDEISALIGNDFEPRHPSGFWLRRASAS